MEKEVSRAAISPTVRREIYNRDKGICQICFDPVAFDHLMHVDHIKHVVEGGGDETSNLRATHGRCNLGRPFSDGTTVVSMGGRARAESLTPERRSEIALEAGKASAAASAACEHQPVRRFSPKTGKPLPGKYCARCRRKLT